MLHEVPYRDVFASFSSVYFWEGHLGVGVSDTDSVSVHVGISMGVSFTVNAV